MQTVDSPNLILFAQHGMTDNNQAIASLAHSIAPENSLVVAPSLGYVKTLLLQIDPLIKTLEHQAAEILIQHSDIPVRIIATSLGGIIWLEVLDRHPEWWLRIHSLILLGCPVGGAALARVVDPFGWGIGIAKDLGIDRRAIAEKIAEKIPTLVIAGDIDNGGDGTVTIASTQVKHAHFVCLAGVSHPAIKNHPAVAAEIHKFWSETRQPKLEGKKNYLSNHLIRYLRNVRGMTDAHPRDFHRAPLRMKFKDGSSIRTWKNPIGIDHVFVVDAQGQYLFGGYVGWVDSLGLYKSLAVIEKLFSEDIEHF